ncbi:MAG: hypothetical protein ACW987_19365 [Candidatus Thorarchaeota archaeon]
MSNTIYIVVQDAGEYEEREISNVNWFQEEWQADNLAEHLNERSKNFSEWHRLWQLRWYKFNNEYEELNPREDRPLKRQPTQWTNVMWADYTFNDQRWYQDRQQAINEFLEEDPEPKWKFREYSEFSVQTLEMG